MEIIVVGCDLIINNYIFPFPSTPNKPLKDKVIHIKAKESMGNSHLNVHSILGNFVYEYHYVESYGNKVWKCHVDTVSFHFAPCNFHQMSKS